MSGFDVDAALRWTRFASTAQLSRRRDEALPFLDADRRPGQALLLDTCVYIDQMQGRAPALMAEVIELRQANHSTVAIQELMHAIGRLNPADRRTPQAIATIRSAIIAMPQHRIFVPDADVLGRAALLSGVLSRLQHYAGDQQMRALHDCVLFCQAQKLGLTVLTANVADFDILLQLLPQGRVLFYRIVG